MSGELWLLVVAGVLVLAWLVSVVVSCLARSRRLDRLHVRVDAARVGLEEALARRAAAAAQTARALESAGRSAPGLVAAASAAGGGRVRPLPRSADGAEARELVENTLTRQLATVDRALLPGDLHAELVDAEQLVMLARRVHNDAVRDTLGLRSRRLVRWLRLAGTAPLPAYFEIADPPAAGVPARHPGRPAEPSADSAVVRRPAR